LKDILISHSTGRIFQSDDWKANLVSRIHFKFLCLNLLFTLYLTPLSKIVWFLLSKLLQFTISRRKTWLRTSRRSFIPTTTTLAGRSSGSSRSTSFVLPPSRMSSEGRHWISFFFCFVNLYFHCKLYLPLIVIIEKKLCCPCLSIRSFYLINYCL